MEENKKSYYAIIPANVRYDADLTPNSKLLYGEITALCNEKGYCWASNAYFGELYNVSKETISRWIKQLINKNYITSELIYREGTKEIINRYIHLCHEGIYKNANTPQDKIIKDNNTINNNTINNNTINSTISKDIVSNNKFKPIIERWNSLGLNKIVYLNSATQRYKMLNTRVKQYGINTILKAIDNINKSSFLKGQNKNSWVITFDWFIKPNNFQKVLEGNYLDKEDNDGWFGQNNASDKEKPKYDFSKYEG